MKNRWIALYVENQVGVLAKVSGLFSGKSYNLQSLTVGTTEDETVSRMTICVTSDDIAQGIHVEVSEVGNDSVLLECKLTERRNNELIALLRSKFKRIEVVRGGAVAIESISTSCR